MREKFLCIMAGLDAASEQRLSALQNCLFAKGFKGVQTMGIPHHITLGIFPPDKEEALRDIVAQAARETPPLPLVFSHIGVFPGGRVLFIAPDATPGLLALKMKFGDLSGWAPHATLLIDQPSAISAAVTEVIAAFAAFSGRVEALHLYEFQPPRHILTVPLG